ncbi:MAG: sigma-70 family RNA polymerase sigma factor [Planctomycetaceae bacterium]
MSNHGVSDTDDLLRRSANGSASAVERLFGRYRDQLRRMVIARLDGRFLRRVDPSDVIQETLAEAHRRLPDYLRDRPIAFYPWLRQLAARRLTAVHRHHLAASKRSIVREDTPVPPISEDSLPDLATRVVGSLAEPADQVAHRETLRAVAAGLMELADDDRELLILRHVEQLSVADTAAVLRVAEGTVKSRHYRALNRLRSILKKAGIDGDA